MSFDDALKSQYDIAIPILNEYGLDAFFFIYSSVFDENPSLLEIYSYFRNTYYENIEKFYIEFFVDSESGIYFEYEIYQDTWFNFEF